MLDWKHFHDNTVYGLTWVAHTHICIISTICNTTAAFTSPETQTAVIHKLYETHPKATRLQVSELVLSKGVWQTHLTLGLLSSKACFQVSGSWILRVTNTGQQKVLHYPTKCHTICHSCCVQVVLLRLFRPFIFLRPSIHTKIFCTFWLLKTDPITLLSIVEWVFWWQSNNKHKTAASLFATPEPMQPYLLVIHL
jgi:hypothetical protein